MSLTKKKLAEILMKKARISKEDARGFISAFISVITDELSGDNSVLLRGFGVIYPYLVRDRVIQTNKMLFSKKIKEHLKPKFRLSTILYKKLNK